MNTERISLVYAGAVRTDEAVVHAYYEVDDTACWLTDPNTAHLYPAPLSPHPIGCVASYACTKGGRNIKRTDSKVLRMLTDAKLLLEWKIRDHAVLTSEAAWQTPALDPLFDTLAPLREAYRSLPEEQQGVLIAQVVRYLVDRTQERPR